MDEQKGLLGHNIMAKSSEMTFGSSEGGKASGFEVLTGHNRMRVLQRLGQDLAVTDVSDPTRPVERRAMVGKGGGVTLGGLDRLSAGKVPIKERAKAEYGGRKDALSDAIGRAWTDATSGKGKPLGKV